MLELQTDYNGIITHSNKQAEQYGFHNGDQIQPLLQRALDKHTWMHAVADAHDGQSYTIKMCRGLFSFCFEVSTGMQGVTMCGLLSDSGHSGLKLDIEEKFLKDMEQIDDVQNAVIATNTLGVVIYANAGVQTIYGWRPQDMVGKVVGQCIVLESQKAVSDHILQHLKDGNVWSGPYTAKHLDGRELPVLVVDYPLFNEANQLIGIVGVSCINDVSPMPRTIQYVATEQAVFSAVETGSTPEKIQKVIEKAVEATQLMSVNMDLITSISHELRTPIHGILSECEHMRDLVEHASVNSELVNELQDSIQIVMSSTVLQLQLVNNILSIPGSTLDETNVKQSNMEAFTDVSVLKFLNDLVLSVGWNLKQKHITAQIHFLSKFPSVAKFNKSYVGQVMLNLLSNAVKYSPQNSKVTIQLEAVDGLLKCCIQDSGPGVSDERIPQLFKKIASVPTKPADVPTLTARTALGQTPLYAQRIASSEGVGLGLNISKTLIESMDGKIWYEKVGRFCFQVPVVVPLSGPFLQSQLVHSEELSNMVSGGLQTKKQLTESPSLEGQVVADLSRFAPVCIAEDNPINQRVLIKMLQKSNIPRKDVAVANDGVECLELCQSSVFKVVLVDFSMPRMDGIEATKRLRARGFAGKIMGITANALQQHIDMGIQAGMDFVLIKPINQVQLVQAMEDLEIK